MPGNPNLLRLRHLIADGWRPDFPPTAEVAPDGNGVVQVPYLLKARNMLFDARGFPRKKPGLTKVNSAVLESGATVMGAFDYWRFDGAAAGTQRRILHVGTKVKSDNADGSFSDIITGLSSGAVPSYAVMNDELVIGSTSDVPQVYDGSTGGALGGTPPNASIFCKHKNRMWAAGVAANPSTLYYSVQDNHEDWTNSGSGSILVDSADGDRITGLASHKDRLFIFKGPNFGSIYTITGSSPTGTDAFAKVPFVVGIGAVAHGMIFPFGDDIGFMSPSGAVHSLSATDRYGSFEVAALSLGLSEELNGILNFTQFTKGRAATDQLNGRVYFTLPVNGSATNNIVLVMDYRFSPPRWTYHDDKDAACVSVIKDPGNSGRPTVMFGGYDGFLRKHSTTAAVDGSTAITFNLETPFMHYGAPERMKQFTGGAVTVEPLSDGDFTIGWTRDGNAEQTQTLSQGGGGGLMDSFVLDTDTLGGSRSADRFFRAEEGGEFRAIQFSVTQAALSEDFRLNAILAAVEVGGESYENV